MRRFQFSLARALWWSTAACLEFAFLSGFPCHAGTFAVALATLLVFIVGDVALGSKFHGAAFVGYQSLAVSVSNWVSLCMESHLQSLEPPADGGSLRAAFQALPEALGFVLSFLIWSGVTLL